VRIAILEDDPDQLALLKRWITDDGHDVHGWLAGREAMRQAGRESFDLFMLDWQVPDISGTEVLAWLRSNVSKTVPILFVTVRDSEQDIVYALEHGADDYMVKPVRRQELLARVRALLRRAYPSEEKKQLSFPPFEIDIQRSEIRKEGTKIDLTPKEFELTVTLFRIGGSLRLASGRVTTTDVHGFGDPPVAGHRYLCFLHYDTRGYWFRIYKLWELRNGMTAPMDPFDQALAQQGSSQFAGMDEAAGYSGGCSGGNDCRFSPLFLCRAHIVSYGRIADICAGLAETACQFSRLKRLEMTLA